jgi:hypothetical protein
MFSKNEKSIVGFAGDFRRQELLQHNATLYWFMIQTRSTIAVLFAWFSEEQQHLVIVGSF